MEEVTQTSQEIPIVKVVEDTDSNVEAIQVTKGDQDKAQPEGEKEEETAFEGEFIKVEKEPLEDIKVTPCTTETAPSVVAESTSINSRELLEAQEKKNELEHELEKVLGALKHSESENTRLKDEVATAEKKLEESGKKYEDLEFDQKKMQEQIKELINVKEAFDGLSLETESSKKKIQDLEKELQTSASEAQKFEELHKKSSLLAESETNRALEFEKLLELAKTSAKEMEDQIVSLQEKIAENQKVEDALKTVEGELEISKSQVKDLTQELDLRKASESQVKEDISALENLFSSTKVDLQGKVAELEKVTQQREAFEVTVADLTTNLAQTKELCSDLEKKLQLSDENFGKTDSLLSQALANCGELEQKLKSLEELHHESGYAATTATQKNLELEEILFVFKADAEDAKSQLQELETQLIASQQRNVELDQQLSLLDLKTGKAETEVKELSEKISKLELELKKSTERCEEHEVRANTTHQRSLELEDLIQMSNSKAETEKKEFSEKVTKLDALLEGLQEEKKHLELELKKSIERCEEHEGRANTTHQRCLELEDSIQVSNSKAETEKKEFSEKISELNASLEGLKEEKKHLELELKKTTERCEEHEGRANTTHQRSLELEDLVQISNSKTETLQKEYSEKVSELNALLVSLKEEKNHLELELKKTTEKCEEHEGRANTTHQRSLELEDLIQISHSKAEGTGKRVNDLELLLESERCRVEELEKHISDLQQKSEDAEAESKKYSHKLYAVEAELEAYQSKASSLEATLQLASDKEIELTECLNTTTNDKKKLEDSVKDTSEKLTGAENLVKSLQNELNLTQQRLESIESDLKDAEEQLGHSTARSLELESLHETRTRDFELKHQEATEKFTTKDSETKSLYESMKNLEDQVKVYEQQITSLKKELNEISVKLESSESMNEEFKRKILESEDKVSQSFSENELLVETNTQLKTKVNELEELLNFVTAEKEATSRKLTELQSETEANLREAIQKFTERDSEAKELSEKLNAVSVDAETRKIELEDTLVKLNDMVSIVEEHGNKFAKHEKEREELSEANLRLAEELAAYESKLNDHQTKLSKAFTEKDEAVENHLISRKTIEDLTQQLTANEQRLQSQLSSVMEENNLINETYKNTKKEAESVILKLEEQLQEHKANEDDFKAELESLRTELESLRAELGEKSLLQTRLKELEEQLATAEAQSKKEVESIRIAAAGREAELASELENHVKQSQDKGLLTEHVSQLQKELHLAQSTIAEKEEAHTQKELEKEKALKHTNEELEAKHKTVLHLETQIKELGQKLELVDSTSKEKEEAHNQKELEREKALKHINEELEAKNKAVLHLETQVKELGHKLELVDSTSKDKDIVGSPADTKDGVEVKSRDIGSNFTVPSKRKSKKKLETTSSPSSPATPTQLTESSSSSNAMTFKIVLGVALVSVIIGIILGKRY